MLPVDFTLKELKSLRVKQRFSFRDQRYNGILPFTFFLNFIVPDSHVYFELTSIHSVPECRYFIMLSYWITGKYQIITFEEYILIALYADRIVGIYPEIKNPVFINQHVSSFDMARLQRKLFTLVM